jgi:hypothetical protein
MFADDLSSCSFTVARPHGVSGYAGRRLSFIVAVQLSSFKLPLACSNNLCIRFEGLAAEPMPDVPSEVA